MTYSFHIKCYFLFHIFIIVFSSDDPFLRKENSLIPPYAINTWDIYGNTLITNKNIVLTKNQQSQIGGIWNTHPLSLVGWEVHIHFKVHGSKGLLFGDGLAIWYLDKPPSSGPVFGSRDQFVGLGIFLDTYSNHNGPHHHQHPYISAMVNDGKKHYDHDSDGTHTQLAGCTCHFRNKAHDTFLNIRYENNSLLVMTDVDNKELWEPCFQVNNVFLPSGYYLGVTAATGELADNHEIVSVKTYGLSIPAIPLMPAIRVPFAEQSEPERAHVSNDPVPWRWKDYIKITSILLILVGITAFGSLVFYFFKRQSYARSHFY